MLAMTVAPTKQSSGANSTNNNTTANLSQVEPTVQDRCLKQLVWFRVLCGGSNHTTTQVLRPLFLRKAQWFWACFKRGCGVYYLTSTALTDHQAHVDYAMDAVRQKRKATASHSSLVAPPALCARKATIPLLDHSCTFRREMIIFYCLQP